MPHDLAPELDELVADAKQDLKARVPGLTRIAEDTVEEAVVVVSAGLSAGVHERVTALYPEIFVATCSVQSLGEWATQIDAPRRKAVFTEGTMLVHGSAGSTLPEGEVIQRDDGQQWQTLDEKTVAVAETWVTPRVRALTSGVAGNFEAGEDLSLASAVAGFTGVVDAGAVTLLGLDLETVDAWRKRVITRFTSPRLGGGPGDFIEVMLKNGATRGWEFGNHFGDGTVLCLFVDDTQVDPIPTPAFVATMQIALDAEFTDTAQITAGAPVNKPINHSIALDPNTIEMRTRVTDELEQFYRDKGDVGVTVQLTGIAAAIEKAAGLNASALLIPSVAVILQTTELPTLGTIAWSTL